MSKQYKFQLVKNAGTHYQEGKEYRAGDTIVSSENLQDKFPGKFLLVDVESIVPKTPALDNAVPIVDEGAEEEEEGNEDAGKKTIVPPKDVGMTVRPTPKNGKFKVLRDDTGEVIAENLGKRDARDLAAGKTITIEA
jgi:hypothetical protein